jgi:hypothetical protein
VKDLETVAYVTVNYPHLQGLRIVPAGLAFLTAAAWQGGWLPWPGKTGPDAGRWFLLLLALALGAAVPIGRYYRTRYGVVHPHRFDSASTLLFVVFAGSGVMVWHQLIMKWAISVPALFVGAALVSVGLGHGGLRRHYVAIGGACLFFAIFGSLGTPSAARRVMLDLLLGGGLVAGGVGDHLVLRRTLHPPSGAPETPAVPEEYDCAV